MLSNPALSEFKARGSHQGRPQRHQKFELVGIQSGTLFAVFSVLINLSNMVFLANPVAPILNVINVFNDLGNKFVGYELVLPTILFLKLQLG